MSLAPSPTAMVRASGHARRRGEAHASAVGLPRPVDDRPLQLAGDHARLEHEHVGRQVVDAQVAHQRADHLGEPAAHHGQLVARAA